MTSVTVSEAALGMILLDQELRNNLAEVNRATARFEEAKQNLLNAKARCERTRQKLQYCLNRATDQTKLYSKIGGKYLV